MSNEARETERKTRTSQNREKEERTKQWQPPTLLPDPEPQEGWVFRWVRTSMVGNSDNTNVSRRLREGWVPVKSLEVPELQLRSDRNSSFEDCVEVGGLLLMKMPSEMAEQRKEYFAKKAMQQEQAVDHTYMADDHEHMRKFSDSSTEVSFGKG